LMDAAVTPTVDEVLGQVAAARVTRQLHPRTSSRTKCKRRC
jgi:hypothetical protein